MATKIVTEHKAAQQSNSFKVHPDDVTAGRNSRMVKAADYDQTVKDRAVSIYKDGQLQPAECRRDEDNRLILTLGFTRWDAIKLLRSGFDAIDPDTGESVHFHKPDAQLWVKVEDCDVDTAFIRGIKENLERKDTTDLQEALAQSEIRTTMGWSDAKIARLYGYTNQNRIMALSKLLTLPTDVQNKVHSGTMALYTALDTLKAPEEERAALLDGATKDGKVDGALFRKLLSDLLAKKTEEDEAKKAADPTPVIPDGPEAVTPAGERVDDETPASSSKVKRTVKELQNWIADQLATREDLSDVSSNFLGTLSQWLKGNRTTTTLGNKFTELNEETK